MRYRIAENSETNRRIDVSRRVPPILQIGQRVNFFRAFSFHIIANLARCSSFCISTDLSATVAR